MAHHKLGNREEARAAPARLGEVMLRAEVPAVEENGALLAEAEALIGSAPEGGSDREE